MFILCIPQDTFCFFWVPTQYTTPYWSGDTHITNRSISSIDTYIGTSFFKNDTIDFTSTNAILSLYQTLSNGLFIETTIPTTAINFKTKKQPLIDQKGGLCYENSTLLIGWGINYDIIPYLDFIDLMIRSGFIAPAHAPLNPLVQMEPIYGYQKWGIPCSLDVSCGFCEWMLFGFHTSICYIPHNSTVWHIEPYFKADHLLRGFSFWIGYSYTGADSHRDTSSIFFTHKKNWHMHTMHYGIEFEIIQYEFPLHPRLGAYYNQYVGGINIFEQSHIGITAGLDIIW